MSEKILSNETASKHQIDLKEAVPGSEINIKFYIYPPEGEAAIPLTIDVFSPPKGEKGLKGIANNGPKFWRNAKVEIAGIIASRTGTRLIPDTIKDFYYPVIFCFNNATLLRRLKEIKQHGKVEVLEEKFNQSDFDNISIKELEILNQKLGTTKYRFPQVKSISMECPVEVSFN